MTKNDHAENKYKSQVRTFPIENNPFDKYGYADYWERHKKYMKFSIVFPTRDRHKLVINLLESIQKNTAILEDIEVLIAVDGDDYATYKLINQAGYSFVKAFQVLRSGYKDGTFDKNQLNFSRDYYTFLANQSRGRWIITINDDCVCETPNWDLIAYDVLKEKSGVIYGWIEDGIEGFRARGHGNYCCFPLQGRAGFEALGYIFPYRVPTWGADIWAKNLYDQINSVVEIPITFRHYCHHNKTREQDNISKRIAFNQVHFDMRPTYEEINKLLEAKRAEMVKA